MGRQMSASRHAGVSHGREHDVRTPATRSKGFWKRLRSCWSAQRDRTRKNEDNDFMGQIPGPDLIEEEYVLSVLMVHSR
jgi:hypothetical protein